MQELQKPRHGYKFVNFKPRYVKIEIPIDWYFSAIDEICWTSSGGTPSRSSSHFYNGDIAWIKTGELNDGYLDKTEEHISSNALTSSSAKKFPPNTVLFAMYGATIGKTCITSIEATTNQACCAFLPIQKNVIDPYFLQQYLILSRKLIVSLGEGAGQPNTSQDFMRAFQIGYPSYNEQVKISSILSKVDELIQKTDQVIEQTQRLKRGLMQKLLVEGIGHRRYKSVRFGPHFLDHDIPDKWQVLTLKQCVRSDTPITYGIVQAGPHVPDGIPYIRTGDMSGDKLSINDMLRTSNEIASSFRRSQVKAGEIVCALRGIVGKVLEVPEELEGANLTQGTARISPRNDIECRCLLWALQSEYARRQFKIFSKGTTLNEITLEQLRTIKVAIPSDIKEQKDLAHILDQLELAIGLRLRYKEKVVMLKAGLMQKLLTGKIRVKI